MGEPVAWLVEEEGEVAALKGVNPAGEQQRQGSAWTAHRVAVAQTNGWVTHASCFINICMPLCCSSLLHIDATSASSAAATATAAAPAAAAASSSSGGSFPAHEVLKMPALSPTMSQGNIISWGKQVGRGMNA